MEEKEQNSLLRRKLLKSHRGKRSADRVAMYYPQAAAVQKNEWEHAPSLFPPQQKPSRCTKVGAEKLKLYMR